MATDSPDGRPGADMTIAELLVESRRLSDNARKLAERMVELASAMQEAWAIRKHEEAIRQEERERRLNCGRSP